MSKEVALFLGAGFSKWSANLPLVSELFDFKIETTSLKEEKRLRRIQQDWLQWNSADRQSAPEQFIYWALNKSTHRRSRVVWYITRRLSDPFMSKILGSYSPLMFDEKSAKEHPGVVKAFSFLSRVRAMSLTGVLTCNYDTLVECALGTSGFNYGLSNEPLRGRGHNPVFPSQFAHRSVTGSIRVAKLHGSLSWTDKEKFTSGKPGREGKALIVPPSPEKKPPPELRHVWDLGRSILKSSNSLVVFGFAFNPYDEALLDFLQSNGEALTRVLLIDPYPNTLAASKLWPQATISTIASLDMLYDDLTSWEKET